MAKSKQDELGRRRIKERMYRRRAKLEALLHYGTECMCCGEAWFDALHIDHVNGGGSAARKAGTQKAGSAFYAWLKRNDWPEGYQTLCANCNFAKRDRADCPCGYGQARRTFEEVLEQIGLSTGTARGEGSGTAKLTEATVREARLKYREGGTSYAKLALEYGVTVAAMFHAINGGTWAHVVD